MDKHERLDRTQDEIWCIEDAIEALKDVRNMKDIIEILNDRIRVLQFVYDEIHKQIEADDARDIDDLTREYYRSVM